MKKSKVTILISFVLLFISYSVSSAIIGVGFFAGLSTPNDDVNHIYHNTSDISNKEDIKEFMYDGMESGYHIGIKGRLSLSESFTFFGAIAWHKFPESKIEIPDPNVPGENLAVLNTTTNIIPISLGVNYYLINSTVGVYGVGELTYNYISNTVDINYNGIPISLNENPPQDNRVGFGFGAGADIDLFLLKFNLEAKYNIANLIGKEPNEKTKTFFTLSIGVFL